MIVDSCDNRRVPPGLIKSGGHPAVAPRQRHNDRAVALPSVNNFHTCYILVIISCLFHFNICHDVSNTTTQSNSIANAVKAEPEERGGPNG